MVRPAAEGEDTAPSISLWGGKSKLLPPAGLARLFCSQLKPALLTAPELLARVWLVGLLANVAVMLSLCRKVTIARRVHILGPLHLLAVEEARRLHDRVETVRA